MKKILPILIFLCVAAFIVWLLPSQRSQDTDQEPIRYSHTLDSLNHAPLVLAQAMGLFEAHGLTMEYVPTRGAEESVIGLLTGQIDIVSGSTSRFITAIDSGAPIKNTNYLVLVPVQLMVRADSGLTSFEDLRGKKIGSRQGSGSDLALRYALEQEGIGTDAVELVELDRSTQLLALTQQKLVDAVVVSQREVVTYERAGAKVLDAWTASTYSTDLSPGTIAMSGAFLEAFPDQAQAFIDALIEGAQYLQDHPVESAPFIAQAIQDYSEGESDITTDDVLEYVTGGQVQFVLWSEPKNIETLSDLMYSLGLISHPLTLDELFDLRFDAQMKETHELVYGI